MLAVGPWQEDLIAHVVRQYAVNESAPSLPEILQMKYHVMRSVEVIYLGVCRCKGHPSNLTLPLNTRV